VVALIAVAVDMKISQKTECALSLRDDCERGIKARVAKKGPVARRAGMRALFEKQ
jgi:hypothetical protein